MPKTAKAPKSKKPAKPAPKVVASPPLPLALVEHNVSRQVHVDLGELHPFTWANPRPEPKPADVEGLARTMERFGLLHPIAVMPNPDEKKGGYLLLAGRRRVAAARLLKWKTIPAHVLARASGCEDTIDHLLGAVALVENGAREDLDPLRDAQVVEAMLGEDGASIEQVAAELGRPRSWVARRAKLVNLSPASREAVQPGGLIAHWPAAWLELLALLPADVQAATVKVQGTTVWGRIDDLATLRSVVRERMARLGGAPWDLADASLDSKAGSCTACGKHTGAQPDLFETPRKFELAEAQCLDGACWKTKLEAWRERSINNARAKHGAELVLLEDPIPGRVETKSPADTRAFAVNAGIVQAMPAEKSKGEPSASAMRVRGAHEFVKAKKGEEGAVPALVVAGASAGTVRWVRPSTFEAQNIRVLKPATRAQTAMDGLLREKRMKLEERRTRFAIKGFRSILEDWIDHDGCKTERVVTLSELWAAAVLAIPEPKGWAKLEQPAGPKEPTTPAGEAERKFSRACAGCGATDELHDGRAIIWESPTRCADCAHLSVPLTIGKGVPVMTVPKGHSIRVIGGGGGGGKDYAGAANGSASGGVGGSSNGHETKAKAKPARGRKARP